MKRIVLWSSVGLVAVIAMSGCNRRVFEKVVPTCDVTIASDVGIPDEKAADILIVVDNSASMQEEQDRLAAAFINDTAACPINKNELKDFVRCGDENPPAVCRFANPTPDVLEAPAPDGLADCGFIQVMAAFENDFRIGVITTDVGICDNRIPEGQAQLFCGPNPGLPECQVGEGNNLWGFRPQRGCLQPNGPPGTVQKVIAREDLLDDDPSNDEIGDRFIQTLENIRVFGSPTERGLDAAKFFFDPNTVRDESCQDDVANFLRDEAKLIIIFLSDEEDCSRTEDVAACPEGGTSATCGACEDEQGCEIFVCPANTTCTLGTTELTGETCGRFQEHFTSFPAGNCYDRVDSLTDVKTYADFFKGLKANPSDVTAAVIAGGLANGDDFVAAGCAFDANNGDVAIGGCFESRGTSNTCSPAENCCFADPGRRYYALADEMAGLKDTICVDSFSKTMIKIAVFIADVDKVTLAEPPENPALVFVEKGDGEEFTLVGRLPGTECGDGNGWVLEDDVTVRFCGTARPGPGEQIRVRAKGAGADGEEADACANR